MANTGCTYLHAVQVVYMRQVQVGSEHGQGVDRSEAVRVTDDVIWQVGGGLVLRVSRAPVRRSDAQSLQSLEKHK